MFRIRRVKGQSMFPNLSDGQLIITTTRRNFKLGDIVVATVRGRLVIKRLAEQDDRLGVYLLGDNPESSTDSREFGFISDRLINEKLIWPRLNNLT